MRVLAMSSTNFEHRRLKVFWIIFVAYVGYYFCRITLPVALPLLEEEFHFSSTQTGLILSVFYATYAFAKLINGFIGDHVGGKLMLLVGMLGSVLCSILFGFGSALLFFIVVWSINAYFQSMGWLGLIPVMASWYRTHETGRIMGFLSLSYQAGDFVARTSAGLILMVLLWSHLFWIHGAITLLIALLLWWVLEAAPPSDTATTKEPNLTLPSLAEQPHGELPKCDQTRSEYRRWLKGMLTNSWFWMVCLVYLGISIVRYIFWGWSVGYLIESGSSVVSAALTSALLPLFGSLGTIFAGWLSDRMKARRGPVIAIMSSLLVVAIYLFSQASAAHPVWLMAALGLVGFFLYGPYSLMAGAVAIDFGSSFSSSSAAGIIDAVGSVGTIATGIGMGILIDRFGWDQAFLIVVGIALASALVSFSLWRMRPPDLAREAP